MVLPSCLVHVLFFDNTVQHSHNIPSERLKGSASQLRWSNLLQPQLDFLEPKNPRLGARMLEVARSCYTNVSVHLFAEMQRVLALHCLNFLRQTPMTASWPCCRAGW